MRFIFLIVISIFIFYHSNLAADYNILEFGAKEGSNAMAAIQEAIDRCAEKERR